ncbi:hypothetical protein niasHT_001813 [Heterodera trifolii]|uniref:THAP-type domain-containing protein n=1 Tax=Heterodera trifolii TaxID=157864 RepID=A0ABD2MBL6_9BILA
MPRCPICGKNATKETGVQFPSDSAKFVRYCLQLKLNPKTTEKKGIICYDHYDPKDLIREGGKIINVSKMAVPKIQSSRLTLDQLLEKNVGMPTSAAVSSLQNNASSSSVPSPRVSNGTSVAQNVKNWKGMPRHGQQMDGQQNDAHLVATEQLADLTKKTLILFRDANESFSDQNAVSDWLRRSFALPANSICELSSPSLVTNSQIFFIVFDEIGTAERILEMSKSEERTQKTFLTSATEFLQSNSPGKFTDAAFSDENAWRNLAAAMVPAYNNLMAAASSQLHHQIPNSNLTVAAVRNKAKTEGNSETDQTAIQTIMSQIDKIIRQGNTL